MNKDRRSELPRDRHHNIFQNGGKLKIAQQMASHESARTTGLYGRRNDKVALDEGRADYILSRSGLAVQRIRA